MQVKLKLLILGMSPCIHNSSTEEDGDGNQQQTRACLEFYRYSCHLHHCGRKLRLRSIVVKCCSANLPTVFLPRIRRKRVRRLACKLEYGLWTLKLVLATEGKIKISFFLN
ncbi:hypothetical protein Mapa_006625 [Marchantia paleacea]|nr:hypothetical protein Mapa_006625 [Marchantia paleacea]